MAIAGLGSGALVAALPSAAAAAAPTGRTAVATGLTNTTKTIGGTFASATFALALSAGVHTTLGGAEGTAGSLTGYMTVWAVCGLTAVLAALCLVVIPRLAFADRSSDTAATPPDEPDEPGEPGDRVAGAAGEVDMAGAAGEPDEPGGERTGVRA
jgi:hypothetical protein